LCVLIEDVLLLGEADPATVADTTAFSSAPLPSNCVSLSLYSTGASEIKVRKTSLRTTPGENKMVESDWVPGTRLAENVWRTSPIYPV
jgi:hypothetical protein